VVGNIIPGELQEVYESIKNGSGDSQEKFDALMPMIKAVQVDVNPIPVKAMTSELGFGNYELRLPLVPLEEAALNEVIQTMRKFKEGSFV
jgi:4-hydroxy-tetrahydrodipicolinate synthase